MTERLTHVLGMREVWSSNLRSTKSYIQRCKRFATASKFYASMASGAV